MILTAEAERRQGAPLRREGSGNEFLVHLDRLTSELQAEHLGRDRAEPGNPPWLRAVRDAWPRPSRQPDRVGSR